MAIMRARCLLRASKSRWLAERFMRRPFARRAVKQHAQQRVVRRARGREGTRGSAACRALGETGASRGVRQSFTTLRAYDAIQRLGIPAVSVKPTQLGLDHSFNACELGLEALCQKGLASREPTLIDMEN